VQSNDRPRVAVITGASSGMGLVAAKALAAQGWRVIGHGRHPDRTAAAAAAIRAAAAPGAQVDMIRADLSVLAEAARAADEIAALADRIDVLINNAGGTPSERVITAEGNEATFAGNHLGHFVLTHRLLPRLHAAAAQGRPGATRIINMASSAHEHSPGLDFANLQLIDSFVPGVAYCNAKLANVLFTRALARRLAGSGIVVHAMHPGAVDTNFASHGDPAMQDYFRTRDDLLTAEQGADTLIWLATAAAPADLTGAYYHERQPVEPSAAARDEATAEHLWRDSEALTARFLTPQAGAASA
jgi:NAD(P)-dependent dehydrogenase (short-subunit alcohol dehydrogenase family)